MGYYTKYELEVDDSCETTHKEAIASLSGYTYLWGDERKWYSHEEDMRKYSKDNPEVLFTLKGEGEEYGDLWVEYYKAGKMQRERGVISYRAYNEGLLT